MEENNDFEKYEGYKDSAETLLGTNEKSSSMTSRERVDSAVEDAGSEVLSKVGVPKGLAKKAVKSNGGKLSPTNYGVNKLAKNFTRNKVAKGLDKMDNLKNKSGANKDKTSDRINQSKKRGNLFSKGKTNKSSNESEGTAKEGNEKKSGLSKSSDGKKSNGKSKLATAARIAKNPKKAAIEAGVNLAKMIWEKKKKKIIMGIAIGAAVTFISVIFIFEVIMGPLMDAFKMADNILTETADFAEKLDNFYSGFGFQDSKEAFYDELDSLCDRYGCSNDGTGLDVPLLLATLFYTEGMGYDTKYGQIEGDDAIDASMNADSSNSGIFAAVRRYLASKFDETQQTVDENGLVYNSGKIYRLRKLARNQFHTNAFGIATRSGQPTTVGLGTFISKFGSTIGTDLKDILERFSGALFSAMYAPFKELYAFIFGSDYSGSFYEKSGEATSEFAVSIVQLICDIFYGIVDITNIDISLTGGIKITYYDSYVFEEDNYKNYLTKYYFEFIPEYREMLNGLSGDERKEKKEYLYREINDNKKLFESVFLEYQNESTESYTDSCVGAVDQNLISELNMPVDIADNATISFDDNYSYGIVNGKTHNGVDLNEKTVGVKLGANVYSVANGKIESIEDSKCTDDSKKCGKSIKIKHNLVIDNNEYNFFTIYSNVTIKSGLKKGDNVAKGDQIGLIYNNASNIEGLHFVFMDANNDAKGTAIDPTNIFIKCTSGGGTFSGSTNEEAVWNYLLGLGYTKNAAAGIMGNMSVESASTFDGRIVQGDYDSNLAYSIDYTKKVDSGAISRNDFANNGPNGGGYGLVQWTDYTIKEGLYDYAKNERKLSVGDTAMQIDYLEKYLQSNNQGLYNSLRQSNISVDSATRNFMLQFERPDDQSESAQSGRVQRAQDIYNRYSNK